MRTVPVTTVGDVDPSIAERAAGALADRRTLHDVLGWARSLQPPRAVAEIVTQDEYTHDVVLPFDGDHFLVFDAT